MATSVSVRRTVDEDLSLGVMVAEFFGSLLLGLFGYWAMFSGDHAPWSLTDGAMGWGIGLFVVALVFGSWGVHANPLLSLGAWVSGLISWLDLLVRSLIQLTGFVLAAGLMWLRHGAKAPATRFGSPVPLPGTPWIVVLFVGILAGFGFALAALYASDRMGHFWGAVVLGLALYLAVYYSTARAGGGVNTARNIASMMYDSFVNGNGWPLWGTIGELIGAYLAGLLYRRHTVSNRVIVS